MSETAAVAAIVSAFGLVIGSFLNVCISRIPQVKSSDKDPLFRVLVHQAAAITFEPSRCPQCTTPIKPYDNIPILSYVLLRGRCRSCGKRISPLYPAVELVTGLLFVACYLSFGASVETFKWMLLCGLMIVLVFTDILARQLPELVNFGGLAAGLFLSFFVPLSDGSAQWLSKRMFDFPPPLPVLSFVDALLGAAIGSGLLWVVAEGYFRLRGREGMGLGDVKMMAMVGAFLGPKRTLLTILFGSLLGSIIGLLFILVWRKGSEYELPFGTFLGASALLVVFYGTPALKWYVSLFGL